MSSEVRTATVEAFLDAAERLLVEVGYAGITTRALAAEAGVNHGLVHYYFGSMEEVLVQVLERFTARLIERQRAMYSSGRARSSRSGARPGGFQEEDLSSGLPEDLVRAAGPGLEPAGAARAHRGT